MPFCVGELGAAEEKARKTSYRFKTQGGLVRELARVNGSGALAEKQNSEYEEELVTAGVALWRFAYGSDARSSEPRLASAVLENKTGKQLRKIGYEFSQDRQQAIARFDRDFNVAERQLAEGSALDLNAIGSNLISSAFQHRAAPPIFRCPGLHPEPRVRTGRRRSKRGRRNRLPWSDL